MLTASTLRPVLRTFAPLFKGRSSLPVLETVRLTISETAVSIAATNLDVFLTWRQPTPMPPDGTLAYFQERARRRGLVAFDGCVNWRDLKTFIDQLPPMCTPGVTLSGNEVMDDPVVLTLTGTSKDGIAYSQPFPVIGIEEFPHDFVADFAAEALKETGKPQRLAKSAVIPSFGPRLRAIMPGIATDETRYVLNGVFSAGNGELVATNGRMLALSRPPADPASPMPAFIVPSLVCHLLDDLLPETPASATFTVYGDAPKKDEDFIASHFSLACGHWQISGKLIDGNYPNYRQVIPLTSEQNYQHLHLAPEDVTRIRTLCQTASKKANTLVHFQTSATALTVQARQKPERVIATLTIPHSPATMANATLRNQPVTQWHGACESAFNPELLLGALPPMDGQSVLNLASNAPSTFEHSSGFLSVIMPIRKND